MEGMIYIYGGRGTEVWNDTYVLNAFNWRWEETIKSKDTAVFDLVIKLKE